MVESLSRIASMLLVSATLVVADVCDAAGPIPPSCHQAADLEPRSSSGRPVSVPSSLTPHGALLRWTAKRGDTLRLRLFTTRGGSYALSLFAVHGPGGPAFSTRLWDQTLQRDGETTIALEHPADEVAEIRFEPVSMGPGHHVLELTCVNPGEILLDCVALDRTGELRFARAGDDTGGRPFLGIEMGEGGTGGVAITRTVPGSAAVEAGLEAGDVLVRIGGEAMDTSDRVSGAILRQRPGDRVELTLLRDGRQIERVATLGRRADAELDSGSRAAHVVGVLDVRPGQVIADIGTGSGWLAEAIAEELDGDGLVYAVEIDERHVRRLHTGWTPHVVPVLSLTDDVSLPENGLDTAMLHDVASHVDRAARPRFYESIARALKPEGRLVIFGPHGRARSMLDELRGYGFVPIDDEPAGDLDEWLKDGIVFRHAPTNPG